MSMSPRPGGFHGEFLWELEIVERQLAALAHAIPEEQYDWRPDATARSAREVFIHIATGNFMLLDVIGAPPPRDLYGEVSAQGPERLWALVRKNDELGASLRGKASVVTALERSLQSVRQLFTESDDGQLARSLEFFGERTTVRRVYLRLLAHMHEHMGQMIAYVRCMGMPAPWPDWRPDRR
jgi:uncharacterized damage-inducible protein DinB